MMRLLPVVFAIALAGLVPAWPVQANRADAAAHAQAMNDIAATPPCCDGGDEGEWEGYEPNFSTEDLERMIRESKLEEAEAQREHSARMAKDSDYRAFFDGFWNFRPSSSDTPGQHCAARFYREGTGLIIMGPADGSPASYLALYGRGIQRPKGVRKIKVKLYQTGEQPQTVEVFNTVMAGTQGDGMLILAVQDAETLLSGMLDTHRFEVLDETQREVLYILEWTGGFAARDKLRSCINSKI